MKVLELIDSIIEEIEASRKALFAPKKTIDVNFVIEILTEIRSAIPKEIERANQIIQNEQKIIESAQEKAKKYRTGMDAKLDELVEDHKVTKLAYEKSNKLLDAAQQRASELRKEANEYAISVLDDLNSYFSEYVEIIKENRANFETTRDEDQEEF